MQEVIRKWGEEGDKIAIYDSFEELMKEPYIGFTEQPLRDTSERYMVISTEKTTIGVNLNNKNRKSWDYPSRKSLENAVGKFFVFNSAKELYQWLIAREIEVERIKLRNSYK